MYIGKAEALSFGAVIDIVPHQWLGISVTFSASCMHVCLQVRISRKRIMESAMKVFEMYGASRAVLEIEYFNEVGTGLGPTLEFYTMLSHDFQRRGLKLWRGDEEKLSSTATGAAASPIKSCMPKIHL